MEANRFTLQKLNNGNYPTWRFKVELFLIRNELWLYVEPGVKPEQEAAATWQAGVAKVRATVGLLVEDNQYGHQKRQGMFGSHCKITIRKPV